MSERDKLREKHLQQKLEPIPLARLRPRPLCLRSVDSTQNYLSRLRNSREGYFVTSEVQTSGRGRHGNLWHSDKGGLYLSLKLEPPAQNIHLITAICAQSVLEILSKNYLLSECWMKEPNDVICRGKKIAGVLVDAIVHERNTVAIAGMGVNVNNGAFWSPEMRRIATSFKLETDETIDLDQFLVEFLTILDRRYATIS